MLNALAAGLIGWGATLLASTLILPVRTTSTSEFERTARNAQIATTMSIASTAIGAVLLLINRAWEYAIAGLGAGAFVYYVVQVAITWRTWRALAAQVELERSRTGGRVTVDTAASVGLIPGSVGAESLRPHLLPVEGSTGLDAAAVVAERSRLRWALRHPRGGQAPLGVP